MLSDACVGDVLRRHGNRSRSLVCGNDGAEEIGVRHLCDNLVCIGGRQRDDGAGSVIVVGVVRGHGCWTVVKAAEERLLDGVRIVGPRRSASRRKSRDGQEGGEDSVCEFSL